MKIKEFIENWKAGKMPVSTKINNNLTLSEGYRAYWELKKAMWKNPMRRCYFNPAAMPINK